MRERVWVGKPTRHRLKWRCPYIHYDARGGKGPTKWAPGASPEEARRAAESIAAALRQEIQSDGVTVTMALHGYREAGINGTRNRKKKPCKPGSLRSTDERLRRWLDEEAPLADYTTARLAAIYKERTTRCASYSHLNELAEVKAFFRWCVKQGWLSKSPAEAIEPQGSRVVEREKQQLRVGEARKLLAWCAARLDEDLPLAVAMGLTMGLRSDEIRCRVGRDVDDCGDGRWLLWIPGGKTKNAKRRLEIPQAIAGALAQRAERVGSAGRLFAAESRDGYRSATWLRKGLAAACRSASVPVVCPHGLRGTFATLSQDCGTAPMAVAAALGHGNVAVTQNSYAAPGTAQRAASRRLLHVVGLGK